MQSQQKQQQHQRQQQQQQQYRGEPPMGQAISAACQWLACCSGSTIGQGPATNKPGAMQSELLNVGQVSCEETRSRSRSSSKSSGSGTSSKSTESFELAREADLNDLVDCLREQSKSANPDQQARSQPISADAQELVSALQDHLKSAVAAAAVAAAAAAAVSTPSSLVAPYSFPPNEDRFQMHQHHQQQRQQQQQKQPQQHQLSCPSRIEPTIRQDFEPLDLKILHDFDWQDLSRLSGTISRSSRSLSTSPRNRSIEQNAEVDIDVDEIGSTTCCVQRTEIVQSLTEELPADSKKDFKHDVRVPEQTGCVAQNLVAISTGAASSTNSCTSLLAAAAKKGKPKQSANSSNSNGSNGNGATTTATGTNQGSQGNQSNDPTQRQRRMFKCRHCPFETDQKVENWLHIRIHMRPERLLSCNSCEFVTEYKHHLEYHQRNHTGYKPFKCPHCDYTCVNNSMLNSHMKSHSTVYQYQCGDCKYATKYVHSLKMHLRKYQHQPAEYMIDIFARKRGPKPGSGRKQQLLKQQELKRQIREQVEQQRALQALQGTSAPGNGARPGGGSRRSRQSQAPRKQQLEEPEQQCILDLRVKSKLAK